MTPLEPPYPPDVQQQFDAVMRGRPPLLLFRTIAASARHWRKFRGASLLDGEVLSLRERELVIDRVTAKLGCEYEWGVHVTAFAKAASLTEGEIAGTLETPPWRGSWSESELALIVAVDALHERADLSDAEFRGLAAHFRPDQILEILLLAGFYRTVAYLANGLRLPLEQTAARFADYQPSP